MTTPDTTAAVSEPARKPNSPAVAATGNALAEDAVRITAPRVFRWSFSGAGMVFAAVFFAISLQPSLLPRAGYVQGIASGITMAIGYGIGAGLQWLWDYLDAPKFTGNVRRVAGALLALFVGWMVLSAMWRQVGWQNEARDLFGMTPVTITVWPVIILAAAVTFGLLLVVSRSLWRLFAALAALLDRLLPRRVAVVLGLGAIVILVWSLINGVLVNGFFTGANVLFSTRDTATAPGITQPTSAQRSGSEESLVTWEDLGRQGRSFVGSGPTTSELDAFSGGGAQQPIRAYVGLKSAATLQERADLLLAELKRTGAFDREVFVLATTTGTGFLDPNGVDPVEFMFNGDTAIAGVQYSYLPSWISLLADQDAVKETSRVVFETVHDYWASLPRRTRPQFYLYGLSLGSFGVESVLGSVDIINQPIDGAFMSGPPFVNEMHDRVTASRDPGTTSWLPIVDEGRTVRFSAAEGGPQGSSDQWGPTRLVYLQHGSDPVVFFSPSLAYEPPQWLLDTPRSPDVPPSMAWFPLVTMWQVALDLPGAGNVPTGHGHLYSPAANSTAWVDVTRPAGWSPSETDRLTAVLEARPPVGE